MFGKGPTFVIYLISDFDALKRTFIAKDRKRQKFSRKRWDGDGLEPPKKQQEKRYARQTRIFWNQNQPTEIISRLLEIDLKV